MAGNWITPLSGERDHNRDEDASEPKGHGKIIHSKTRPQKRVQKRVSLNCVIYLRAPDG